MINAESQLLCETPLEFRKQKPTGMRQPVLKVTHNANATNTSNFSTGIDFNKKANRTISKLSVDLRKELRDHNH